MKPVVRRTIGYWLGAVALFAVFLGFFLLWLNRDKPEQTPEILILGDSIFANDRSETSLPALLQQKLGVTIQDASFGGTSASYLDKDASLAHTLDNYCLAALARAITTGDFRVQRNARVNSQVITYFADRMAELEEVDLSGVKILLIDHCINDYQGGAVISDEQNPYNEYTYTGALRYALKNLQKEYPDLRIIMVSPTPVWYVQTGKTGSDMDHGGGVLDQYVEAQRAVAEEFGVEWIDLYHGLYPEGSWDVGQQVSNDGIHPNEVGRELIAERLAEYLQ